MALQVKKKQLFFKKIFYSLRSACGTACSGKWLLREGGTKVFLLLFLQKKKIFPYTSFASFLTLRKIDAGGKAGLGAEGEMGAIRAPGER